MTTRNCPRCQHNIDYLAERCDACGAHISTELEIEAFHKPAIDSARKMILIAGLYYPLVPILLFTLLADISSAAVFSSPVFLISMGVGVGLFGLHVALWWWAKHAPLPAASIALAVFVGFVIWSGDITSAWLPKVVALFVLSRAVYAGYRVFMLRRGANRDARPTDTAAAIS